MRLNLAMNVNPKDTLRSWATELRKRVFSSPEEFVWKTHVIDGVVSGGSQTFALNSYSAKYLVHGKICFYLGELVTTATGVPAFGNGVTIDLPAPYDIPPAPTPARRSSALCLETGLLYPHPCEMLIGDQANFYDATGAAWANGFVQFYWDTFYPVK